MSNAAEEWRPVVGYEREYEVSSLGGVRNVRTGNRLSPTINKTHRYAVCALFRPKERGGPKTHRVHRLVAMAFIPNPEGKGEVNHKDCDRSNNVASNLEWTTKRENIDHAIREGRYASDIVCPWQKLTAEDEAAIRADAGVTPSHELAARYGVTRGHITKVRRGRTRRGLGETYASRPMPMSRACGPEDKS